MGEEESRLHAEVPACGLTATGQAGEIRYCIPRRSERWEGVVKPLPEVLDIGEDLSAIGLWKEAIVWCNKDRGICEAEVQKPF